MKALKLIFILFMTIDFNVYADKNEQLVTQGKGLYNQHCVMCHGASGAGDGPVGSNLSKKIQPFKKYSDKQIIDILNGGKKDVMPDYRATLTAEQKEAIAKYINSL
ncbi:cytochrome c [Pigmentibacter sp. JX0631]|uniref:c-type cytochrome n=1 Tax=Pigmentibacter sp. JX0631 TaxID=2976982 RepID=UPI0024688B5E|nr:cytochrome c [Pigmentibacter sp. JX0631]WGL60694.1 cytochrome c [Pigmentibacter sp. JX0631]